MTERFLNYVDGHWAPSRTGRTFTSLNPANIEDVIGAFPKSDPGDVEAAVAAAKRAFPGWRDTPGPQRGEILYRIGEIMTRRKEELARVMTRENGKVLTEARGDVQEAIDTAFYHAGEGRRLFGFIAPSELRNKFAMAMRTAVGVVGVISPWNFPIAIPTWKMFPALMAGNTIVFKPASDTPHCAHKLLEVLIEAGVPAGVVNLVHGGGNEVGTSIVQHPDVKVVTFTGSSAIGKDIAERCGRRLARVSLELGGKNAQIVMDDADLNLALEGALWGAFATAGQRCTATSRLIIHQKVRDEFVSRLVQQARQLRLGYGLDAGVQVGPLINEARLKEVAEYVEIGKREGARLLTGGIRAVDGDLGKGIFFQPTIFDGVTRTMRLFREEVFGPLLGIVTVQSFEEAVETLNDSVYGLSSSIYTRDVNRAFKAIEKIEAGIVYVNGPTIGAESHLPFGGVKETGNGHREASQTVYDVFTEWKTVYVDYSGKLQRAQIDTEGSAHA